MYHLTIIERIVIESLNKSEKTLDELSRDIELDKKTILNVLFSLLSKNLVIQKVEKYYFNENLSNSIREELKNKANIVIEMNSIVKECIKSSVIENSGKFKFKKVYMTEKEKKLLQAMFYNIESFLNELKNNKGPTSKEEIIFWGGENYVQAAISFLSIC